MPIPAALAGSLSGQGAQIGETVVSGLKTLLGGLDAIINPQDPIPPFIGMASTDFMNMGLAAIMASTNTNLAYAKQQAVVKGFAKDLADDIAEAELSRQDCAIHSGAKAHAMKTRAVGTKPTKAEVEEFYATVRHLTAVQNTQKAQMQLYADQLKQQAKLGARALKFDFKGLLRKIIKGAGTVFKYADKAKSIYDKAKPYLEKI